MGFNPRIAPYSINRVIPIQPTSAVAAAGLHHFPIFKFPFAGQLVGAYANIRKINVTGAGADASVAATTATGINQVSLWKHATDDTTATYATSLRSAARTGDKNSEAGGGIAWALPANTATTRGLYTLTNKSAARRKYNAGDVCFMCVAPYGLTNANRPYEVTIQADYIIGEEAS